MHWSSGGTRTDDSVLVSVIVADLLVLACGPGAEKRLRVRKEEKVSFWHRGSWDLPFIFIDALTWHQQ